ncbi:hypothetical protein H8356DRAFT_947913 [Neocallimastix lanati (nom. inval.)]|jgi:hypothetical protein|nr:hypothetical protein H8356DRAFT_947913 [Neocallimastix sp. JGI-2020a]
MLSNRLSDSIRNSENKLSKKEKKRLAKAALEEAEVESCTPSDGNDEKVNKYLNIINKKLRTLRKRMNKIEKYENCDVKELNADQITTIKKKSEVSSLIKEFEDLHKQYTLFDQQDQKELEVNKKLQEEKLEKKIKEEVENEKKLHSSQLQYLFKVTYSLNVVINTRKIAFSQSELNALSYVRNLLLGSNEIDKNNEQKTDAEILLEKLYEKSTEECYEGVTYKDVNDLVDLILNPPHVNKKDNSQGLSFFSQDANVDFNEQQPQPHQQLFFTTPKDEEMTNDPVNEVSFSMSKINFMQPNECIEEENETEEVKHEEETPQDNQKLEGAEVDLALKENPTVETNEEINTAESELTTEETQASVPDDKKSTEQPQQNSGYQNNQNNQFQKKRGYYRGGRGRRGYQNGQYNNRHGNGNGYKGSRNHGYYPQQQNQNYNSSYYYNNRSATF